MPHPFFDAISYPWSRADARAWHTALYENIKTPARIDVLYQASGPGLAPLPTPPAPPDVIWKAGLEQLSAARKLESLCTSLLKDASLNSVHKAVQAVLGAESSSEQLILETDGLPDLAFVNRKNLRIELDKLASSSPTVRVLLIRGDPKSGRTWTRHLVERKASELGEGPIVYFSMVTWQV